MKQTLLVTGASGQLGRRVVSHLLDTHKIAGNQIIALTRNPDGLSDLAKRGVSVRKADFDDQSGLATAFAGASRALIISTDQVEIPGARQKQHHNAVAAAAKAGVKHAIYTSMMRPEPGSPISFAPDHYRTEQALDASPLTWTILRNCFYTDFLLFTLPQVVSSGQLYSAAGDLGSAYVTREDCARAAAAALASESTAKVKYDITGPAAINPTALAKIATELTGKPINVIPVTAEQLTAGLKAAGLPPPLVELTVSLDINTRMGNVARVSDAVSQLTGKPPQSVRDFLAAHSAALTG